MLETKLKEIALEVLKTKVTDEKEKELISDQFQEIESNFTSKEKSLLSELREKLGRFNKLNSDDKDKITKTILKNMADSYNGVL